MIKKWEDPIDRLLRADGKARTIKDHFDEIERFDRDSVLSIDVDKIIRWKYKDRPENELGDIDDLAETFKSVGQQQPCIVRKLHGTAGKYELLVGERRWKAAEKAGLQLKCIIKEIDDKTATLIQVLAVNYNSLRRTVKIVRNFITVP